MKVYLDNAATTALDPEVFEAMKPYLLHHYGNPSSTHAHGREVRSGIEYARKQIASLLNASPGEIIFTSGGTEADNAMIRCSVDVLGITDIITSKIEHHAVLHTVEELAERGKVKLHYVALSETGCLDYEHLESLLKANPKAMVTLMHANNEIGNIYDIQRIGELCEEYDALFHSDTVQTIGHYAYDLSQLKVHGIVGSAHKFHGPKGVGFLYISKKKKIKPFISGGAQERNMRGGTENVYGIIGLAKALEIAYRDMAQHQQHIQALKNRMMERLIEGIPGIAFNGKCHQSEESLYTVLNVSLPSSTINDMLVFQLDLQGISASGGSACSSGALAGSHVIANLNSSSERGVVRFSFSKYNTIEEIDYTAGQLKALYSVEV